MELDLVSMAAGAVIARAGGDVTGVVTAPARAVADLFKARVMERLQRHTEEVDRLADGEVEAPDGIRVKAAVEAALADDPLTHRYLAGVVAGSTDDSGTATISMIGRLAARDLRLHYVLYRELHRLLRAPDAPFLTNIHEGRGVGTNLEMFLELNGLRRSMELPEGPRGVRELLAALRALAGEDLISPYGGHGMSFTGPTAGFTVGSVRQVSQFLGGRREAPADGAVIRPSVTGMSLMAWAFCPGASGDPTSYRALDSIPAPVEGDPADVSAALVVNLPRV